MTTADLQAALAAMTGPCKSTSCGVYTKGKALLGGFEVDCELCKGTGTVPLFPDERDCCEHRGPAGHCQVANCPGYSVRAADGIRVMVSIQRLGLMFNLHSCFPPDESISLIWQVDDGKK